MGNHHSSSSGGGGSASRTTTASSSLATAGGSGSRGGHHHRHSIIRRATGSLGLSKAELERRCKPSGLYPSCKWEERAIRRQIADGKLAARLGGSDIRTLPTDQECPICFLHYTEINTTSCCHATVCTECYLQIRPQKEKHVPCPFCNFAKVAVTVAKRMEVKDVEEREKEEQVVIEAKIRARANTFESSASSTDRSAAPQPAPGEFGSSLVEQNRTRSESMSSVDSTSSTAALTPAERRILEEEMRAQLSHPLSRRMEAEAEERRFENEREYYRSHSHRVRQSRQRANEDRLWMSRNSVGMPPMGVSGRRDRFARLSSDTRLLNTTTLTSGGLIGTTPTATTSRSGGGGGVRDWNSIVDAFEGGGNGEVNSLDDLVVIEAAILLSMEEEAARNRATQRANAQRANQQNEEGDEEETNTFDAAEEAGAGFPSLRSRLSRLQAIRAAENNNDDDDDDDEEDMLAAINGTTSRRSRRNQLLLRRHQGRSSAHMDTAGMLMRGITEEEQIAMALALSLRDAEAARVREQNNNNDGNDNDNNNNGENDVSGEQTTDGAAGEDNVAVAAVEGGDDSEEAGNDGDGSSSAPAGQETGEENQGEISATDTNHNDPLSEASANAGAGGDETQDVNQNS